jgi:peptidoglycan lytic transglycosylase
MSPTRSAVRAPQRPTRAQVRRRRILFVLVAVPVAVILGLGLGILLGKLDVQRAIRELTLPLQHDDIIRQQATEKSLDPAMIAAVIYAESRFHDQESHAGALGLMQITPQTAHVIERLSGGTTFVIADLSDPEINIRYGSFYLRYLLDHYDGNEVAALAAYNAGTGNVDRWGGSDLELSDIGFPETRAYVEEVLDKQQDYRDQYADDLGIAN